MLPSVTLDFMGCTKCGIEKPLTEFHWAAQYKERQCKSCKYAYHKQWINKNREKHLLYFKTHYQQNKEAYRLASRKKDLKKFGISEVDYKNLFLRQNGLCAICLQTSIKNLCVDHDHKTGKVRGLLCFACNVSLGHMKDSVELLNNMITYLRAY